MRITPSLNLPPWREIVLHHLCSSATHRRFFMSSSRLVAFRWLEGVQVWRDNLLRALYGDSVPSPEDCDTHWLFYVPESERACFPATSSLSISCRPCRKCREVFTTKKRGKARCPSVEMPKFAQASGLLGGPPPKELLELSNVGRQF